MGIESDESFEKICCQKEHASSPRRNLKETDKRLCAQGVNIVYCCGGSKISTFGVLYT